MRRKCSDARTLSAVVDTIINDGGEGIVIRKTNTPYFRGRSELLWKLKTVRSDTEALVLSTEEDNSVVLQTPNGATFAVPHDDAAPAVKRGDVVTFVYDNYTRHSIPSNPKIHRLRYDIDWGDVVRESLSQTAPGTVENTWKPYGYWSAKNSGNVRLFFEEFAKSKHMDPLQSDTWYSTADEVRQQKEIKPIAAHYGGYIKALQFAFPEIAFQESEFRSMPNKYWKDIYNRYKLFSQFAKRHGFDPLMPEGWYSLSIDHALQDEDINSVISYYNNSISSALMHIFPNIGLDKVKLSSSLGDNPYTIIHQRRVLFNFAERHSFDPLVASNWYFVSSAAMESHVDTRFINRLYKGNIKNALMTILPDIGLIEEYFHIKEPKKEITMQERKQFFDAFARGHNFDPLKPENWYSVTKESIQSKTNAHVVLSLYNRNHALALLDIYPSIGLTKSGFGYWDKASNRKQFFNQYAKANAFDPLVSSNWYPVKKEDILKKEGGRTVLGYYKGLRQALIHLYPRIGLENELFSSWKKPGNYWADMKHRKMFFDEVAKHRGLDPLVATHWCSLRNQDVFSLKGARAVLQYHNKSIVQALMALYPNIGLQQKRFAHVN